MRSMHGPARSSGARAWAGKARTVRCPMPSAASNTWRSARETACSYSDCATSVTFCGPLPADTFNKGAPPGRQRGRTPERRGEIHARVAEHDRPVFSGALPRVDAVRWCSRSGSAGVGRERAAFAGLALAALGLVLLGVRDSLQQQRSVLRNYPVIGHLRFLLEYIRPEIRQYFLEADNEQTPFSRQQRSIVYQRAKGAPDKRPFGTQLDQHAAGYEWINHSLVPTEIATADFRVTVGSAPSCTQPYSASIFNVSAMSFGALSGNAIQALNGGAKKGGFAHDTGEGSISPYHRLHGGDLIWEIGSGYFGCRDEQGRFSEERFVANATDPQVKMIEIKLSQGAKPGHGGVLPGSKVTAEIAATRGVQPGEDCVSPARHSEFGTPIELLQFVERLRKLSGGKPTGFKLCIGHPWEWFAICKAMIETGLAPDFIVVDGSEGGTGAAPLEFVDHVGTPLQEGLLLVCNTLGGLNLRHRIKVGCSGKIISAFDIARALALGADWCNSARGFMFALGCLQAQTVTRARVRRASRRRIRCGSARSRCRTRPSASIGSITTRWRRCASWRRRPGSSIRTSFARRISCGACRTTTCVCYRTCCRTCRRGCCSRRPRAARSGRTACSRSTGRRPIRAASRRSGWTRLQAQSRSSESYTNRQPSLPASACAASLLGSIHRYRFGTPRSSSSRFNAVSAAVPCPWPRNAAGV